MKIAIIGTGYVGLVTGACFSEMGANVTCIDIDKEKVKRLKEGILPIYEPGLGEIVTKNIQEGRLHFTDQIASGIKHAHLVFCSVGTPPDKDGNADLKYVLGAAKSVGEHMSDYTVFITKSTVPVGTSKLVKDVIAQELKKRNADIPFDVASNPEFLKEGNAIKDFLNPERVVVGVESSKAKKLIERLYRPFVLNGYPIIFMDIASSEMTKYAANAMLATRISFMNDIANLCELVGANVDMVRKGIATDSRIGSNFLYAGCGYGGSCFPKDVKALAHTGKEKGYQMRIIEAVEDINQDQKLVMFTKLTSLLGTDLHGKHIAIWGLAFKPETDDMREAPSLVIIEKLKEAGATISAFDPVSMDETRKIIGNKINYAKDMYDAAKEADALMLLTEWKQFRIPDWKGLKKLMKGYVILDGRNIYDDQEVKGEGFEYIRIGKNTLS
ncbi:MAG: UDP-glucose dehydrogenase family protein [Tannerellaceae bacterium]